MSGTAGYWRHDMEHEWKISVLMKIQVYWKRQIVINHSDKYVNYRLGSAMKKKDPCSEGA